MGLLEKQFDIWKLERMWKMGEPQETDRYETAIKARAEELLKLVENCGRALSPAEYDLGKALIRFRKECQET